MEDTKVIVYTQEGCPRCEVLKEKLTTKGIKYDEVTNFDRDDFAKRGYTMLPVMECYGKQMGFSDANKWISER